MFLWRRSEDLLCSSKKVSSGAQEQSGNEAELHCLITHVLTLRFYHTEILEILLCIPINAEHQSVEIHMIFKKSFSVVSCHIKR